MTEKKDFTITLLVDNTPKEAFDAINNVRGWWSEDIEGRTDELGEFKHHYRDIHRCTMGLFAQNPDYVVHHIDRDMWSSGICRENEQASSKPKR
jgi:hypothetical protein